MMLIVKTEDRKRLLLVVALALCWNCKCSYKECHRMGEKKIDLLSNSVLSLTCFALMPHQHTTCLTSYHHSYLHSQKGDITQRQSMALPTTLTTLTYACCFGHRHNVLSWEFRIKSSLFSLPLSPTPPPTVCPSPQKTCYGGTYLVRQ